MIETRLAIALCSGVARVLAARAPSGRSRRRASRRRCRRRARVACAGQQPRAGEPQCSASTAGSRRGHRRSASGRLRTGIGLAGERRLVDLQLVARDDHAVGGKRLAGGDQHEVAGHELARGNARTAPRRARPCARGREPARESLRSRPASAGAGRRPCRPAARARAARIDRLGLVAERREQRAGADQEPDHRIARGVADEIEPGASAGLRRCRWSRSGCGER